MKYLWTSMSAGNANLFVFVVLATVFQGVRGLECYSCNRSSGEDTCNQTTTCQPGEVCMLQKMQSHLTSEVYYETKCILHHTCMDTYQTRTMTAFIGRKRLMSTLYIQGHCLVQCCDQDLCNVGCNQTSLTVTSAPIQTPHPSPTKDTSSQVTATTPNIKIPTKPSTTLSTDVPTTSAASITASTAASPTAPKASSTTVSTTAAAPAPAATSTTASTAVSTTASTAVPTTGSMAASTAAPVATSTAAHTAAPTASSTTIASTAVPTATSNATSTTASSASITNISAATSSYVPSVASTSTTAALHLSCGDRLESYQTSCYIFSHREMSFDSAKAFCAHQRAYLVRVDTAGENMFLTNKIKLLNKGWVQYWLGINVSGGVWYYTGTNVTSTFAEWAPHEPDGKHTLDGDDNIANCAVISPYVGFKWRDEGCSPYEMAETICEMRNPSLP